ncbi:IclR family transcriptional regulator [Sphingomonas carotinifaciens]|uniref:IclR family transcriptional regulator n=1 Tax=Sphingomonas carotinifaciens TaxID=1166323 RepID=UPI000DDB2E6C|nr:IclR family transcriptional regulator [Sphingomonas carotinifaciens]
MAERKERKGSYAAPALDKAFLVIELLADHPQGLLASEMASALGRSLGELFRIVVVMEEAGYLQKSPVTDRYTITYKFLDIAYRATPTRQLTAAAVPEMQALARATEQSCHLVVAKHAEGLVIAREENPGVRGFALRLGASIDLLRSCSGQVILAFSAPAAAERLLDRIEAARGTDIDRTALSKRLEEVRAKGGDMRESPVARGVTDVSYPVFGFGGEVMAALTIPFLELIDGSQAVDVDAAREMLAAATLRISRLLGHVAEE